MRHDEEHEEFFREQLKQHHVLLVEDDKTSRLMMDSLLSKLFDTVHHAAHGEEALEVLKSHKIPLVITDINMPVMDGMKLTQHIREHYPKTHIIMMSADNDSNILIKSVNLGIDGYILKPISNSNVMSTMFRVGAILVNESLQEQYAQNLASLNTTLQDKIRELEEANTRYERMMQRFNVRISQEYLQSKEKVKQPEPTEELEKIEKEHLDELAEIEYEVDCFANLFILKKVSSHSMGDVAEIGNKLYKYQSILKKYPYHLKLSDSLAMLAQTLQECENTIKPEHLPQSGPYFDSLFFMLARFREEILSKLPNVKNPNIFDASMIADIEQIIMLLKGEHSDSDIEFF